MTQQTKTVEEIAQECALSLFPGYRFADGPTRAILRAISDAVKGSGAVEALKIVELTIDAHDGPSCPKWITGLRAQVRAALKALELPDHAERGTKQ